MHTPAVASIENSRPATRPASARGSSWNSVGAAMPPMPTIAPAQTPASQAPARTSDARLHA